MRSKFSSESGGGDGGVVGFGVDLKIRPPKMAQGLGPRGARELCSDLKLVMQKVHWAKKMADPFGPA